MHNTNKEFSFKKYAWTQFKKNKIALVCLYLLFTLIILAVFAPYIANDRPLYAVYNGKTLFPAFASETRSDSIYKNGEFTHVLQYDITDWRSLDLISVVWAPIPYSPSSMDRYNRDYASPSGKQRFKNKEGNIVEIPSKFRHKLGTDGIGRDLAAGLIHGTRISLMVGLVSMGIAALIGIILGALAGFFGDNKLQMPRIKYWMTLFGLFMGIFYGFGQRKYILSDAFGTSISNGILQTLISVIIIFGTIFLFRKLSLLLKFRYLKDETNIPIDTFVSRGIELLNSIPRLLLIITITAVVERSIWIVMIIIGLTSWTGIARFTRAEFLRIRSLEFVQAAESLGFSSVRTIFKHALPNALAPVFVSIAFGIASAILIESGLSFLGIGVPTDIVTWGSLLNLGRQNLEAWWLIIYPGMAIFITITIYNMIAEASRDALDPKLKS
ncbi:ABC transporter permease [Flavobacteriales bacterium]|nr:ABC transporter permease [Flavobacteriales bacterium]MDA7596344.1 ABC transporter permease [Flavobacteriales bacterium]